MLATVVTAFYEIPSKFHSEQYWIWIKNFISVVEGPIVLFTSSDLVVRFKELIPESRRDRIVIIVKEFKDLHHNKFRNEYQKSLDLDYQKGHSIDLYIIWAEKVKFVMKAIEINPFNTDRFVWCDIGIFRQTHLFNLFKGFPQSEYIPFGGMTFLMLGEFTESDKKPDRFGIKGQNYFENAVRLGGGVQAGTVMSWKVYNEKWDDLLCRYFTVGKFAGQDQCIIGSIYLENPDLFNIVKPKSYGVNSDPWFYMLYYLSEHL